MRGIENIVKHGEVSEKVIERYLSERVKGYGGICLKYANSNLIGYPDRVILLPHGLTCWAEIKSKGKKPSKAQQIRHQQMEDIGHHVFVIDSKDQVDELMDIIKKAL